MARQPYPFSPTILDPAGRCERAAGLTSTREYMRLRDGEATMYRELGAGAPMAASPAIPARVRNERSRTTKTTVLYVEDDKISQLIVSEMLSHYRWLELLVADDGASGLQAVRRHRPDLVLLDLQLPDMHGLQILETLRSDPQTADVPVVMLSASAMDEDVRSALERGANAYWTKPLDFGRFEHDLLEVLQLSAAGRRSAE
jgi:CheY-like chemotaxis protein